MSTKAQLVQLDETNIKNNPAKVTPVNHSLVNNAFIDEFFTAPKTENSTTPTTNTILGNLKVGWFFDVTFKKLGNIVFVYGRISNISGATDQVSFCEIINDTYKIKTGIDRPRFSAIKYNSNSGVSNPIELYIDILNTFGTRNQSVQQGEYIAFNGFYFVND